MTDTQLETLVRSVDPERFDYDYQIDQLVELLKLADTATLLERTGIGITLRDHSHRFGFPNRNIGIRPRGLQYLYGIMSTLSSTGDSTVTYKEVGEQFAKVRDAYLLSKALPYVGEEISYDKYRLELGLVERELDTGRFAELKQPRRLAAASYSGFDEEMAEVYGFTIDEAIRFSEHLEESLQANSQPLSMAVAHFFQANPNTVDTIFTQDATEQILPGEVKLLAEDDLFLEGLDLVDRVHDHLGDVSNLLWLEIGSLIRELPESMERESFVSYLHELSVEVGEPDRSLNPDFRKISEPNPIHASPLLEMDGRYFISTIDNLDRCLAETFYYGLRSALTKQGRKKDFDNRWGEYAEDWVRDQLQDIATSSRLLSNVNYNYRGKQYESDFVLLGDDKLLVIEVKTKKLPVATRDGNLNPLSGDVEEGIGEAYEQARRFLRAVLRTDNLDVEAIEGEYTINRSEFDLFQPMIVLRDSYDHLATLDYSTVLDLDDSHPYVVDFYPLERILECLPNQETFIEYVTARREEQRQGNWFSNDELDYLGRFMKCNSRFPGHNDNSLRRLKDYSQVLDELSKRTYGTQ